MTLAEAAKEIRRRQQRLRKELVKAERENGKLALSAAHALSRGPYKTAALKQMYRPRGPYSTADPHPPLHPAIVNLQDGTFDRSWLQLATQEIGGDLVTMVINTDPKGDDLAQGTATAIARPLVEEAEASIERQVQRNRQDAIDRAMS